MKLDDFFVSNLTQKIEGYMLTQLETITKAKAQEVAQKYVAAVVAEVSRNYFKRNKEDIILNIHYASLNKLRNGCGRYGPRKQERYWWPVLNKLSPVLNIIEKGNNLSGQLSRVQTLFEYDWDEAAINTIHEAYENNKDEYDVVDIDMSSLDNFLRQAPSFYKSKQELARVVDAGTKILKVAAQRGYDDVDGQTRGLLPMLKRPAASGRMYYGGINLQNCPSAVRHAALGPHFSYDLKRSVFAWQLSMLRLILGEDHNGHPPGTLHTREYVFHRDMITEQLMPTLKDSLYNPKSYPRIIKEAITAIGFGARRSGGYFSPLTGDFVPKGLRGVINNADSLKQFKEHPWVKGFIKEQDAIVDIITDFQIRHDPKWKTDPRTHDNKGKYSKKVFISFLYQHSEAQVMRQLIETFADKDVLLWVHDGFCTRHEINMEKAHVIMTVDAGMYYWQLDPTFHKGWSDPNILKLTPEQQRALNEQQDREERAQRHRAEIEMWASRGHDVSSMRNQPLPVFQFKNNTQGHYSDGVSDYDAGRDPNANTNRGLLSEQQFIKRIYGK